MRSMRRRPNSSLFFVFASFHPTTDLCPILRILLFAVHPFGLVFLNSTQWQSEVSRASSLGKPVILVGTKSDLRNDPDALQRLEARHLAPTSFDQGLRLAREMGAASYVECASNSPDGLSELTHVLENLVSGGSKTKRKGSKSSPVQKATSSKSETSCCSLV